MMHPFMELNDDTCIVHSAPIAEQEREHVKVYIEKPNATLGFRYATCCLPEYKWEDIYGFTDNQMDCLKSFIESTSSVIIKLARKGGFGNAAGF